MIQDIDSVIDNKHFFRLNNLKGSDDHHKDTIVEIKRNLGLTIPVLDKGFVRLVDYLGSDSRIVQSARVSYGDGTKTKRSDEGLIDYLLRNEHTSPFEQCVMTFHVKAPIFVIRQLFRHRTIRVNEISGRYSVLKDEFYIPNHEDINLQSKNNKQARGESVDPEVSSFVCKLLEDQSSQAYIAYNTLIEMGVAREIARLNLSLSLYSEFYIQVDLNNLFKILKLRNHSHAQLEIQRYAQTFEVIGSGIFPAAFKSYEEHIKFGVKLSRTEVNEVVLPALLAFIQMNGESIEGISEKDLKLLKSKFGIPKDIIYFG